MDDLDAAVRPASFAVVGPVEPAAGEGRRDDVAAEDWMMA